MAQRPAYRTLLVASCLFSLAARASAQTAPRATLPPTALQWVRLPGTEDCSSGAALARAVEAKLGRRVFPAPRDAQLLIEGHVEHTGEGYSAQLSMRGSDGALLGSRELRSQASDCRELSETLAVVLAVMIDPDAAARAADSTPPAEAAPAASAESAPPYGSQRLMTFVRGSFGLLPTPAYGIGMAYETGLGRWGGLRLEGVGYLTNQKELPLAGVRGELLSNLFYAGLEYCPLWLTTGRLRSAACAGAELGFLDARRSDSANPAGGAAKKLWGSGALSARLAIRLFRGLEAHLGASLLLPIQGIRYHAEPASSALRSINDSTDNNVAASADIGLGARF